MKILALEFSSSQRSVAVLESRVSPIVLGELSESGGRTGRTLGLIEDVLRMARLEREEIECLAIGLGPGSYTGIRSAIALAQGWQLARSVKLLGISSVECLATQVQEQNYSGKINIVIDAQRNEFCLAGYEVGRAVRREFEPLRLAARDEVQVRANAGETVAGPAATRWFADAKELFPSAATLGKLAASRGDFVSGEKLEPIYLRETSFVKAPQPRMTPDQPAS